MGSHFGGSNSVWGTRPGSLRDMERRQKGVQPTDSRVQKARLEGPSPGEGVDVLGQGAF